MKDSEVLNIVEENIYDLMEQYETQGECSFCGADLTEADTMRTAAMAHLRADGDGDGACPIGQIRWALFNREKA